MNSAAAEKSAVAPSPYRAIAKFGLPLLVIAIGVVTGLREPHFLSLANAQNLARQLAPLQIVVIGQLFALLSGGLDLSVASVMACSGVVGILALPYIGLAGASAAMILTGLAFGLGNGALIVGFSVSPFIVTLGMLSVAKGLSLLLTGGLPLYAVPESLVDVLGFGTAFGVPISSLVAFAAMLAGAFVLRTTIFGRHVYAVGSNEVAARNSGVRVDRVRLAVYAISGAASGLAAIVMTAWVSAAQPLAGEGMELQSIAAVVVGGVALAGGSGNMLQAFYGVLVLDLLSNALNMAGVSSFLQVLVVGIVILLAVIVDRLRTRTATK
jgi:ribose transport system permease protein